MGNCGKIKPKIILASKSPRRRELLEKAGIDFDVYVPKGKEIDIVGKEYSEALVTKCAMEKAKCAFEELQENQNLIIAACDTVVVNDNIIIGKPRDKKEAINILRSLSGKMHTVVSAICLICCNEYKTKLVETKVTFRKISDDEIISYIDRCEPFDKAGSYGIQDEGFDFAVRIDGDVDNVIGLPVKAFKELGNF